MVKDEAGGKYTAERVHLDGESVFKVPHPDRWGGKVGFTCLRMSGRFKNIEVKAPDGKVLWEGPAKLPE